MNYPNPDIKEQRRRDIEQQHPDTKRMKAHYALLERIARSEANDALEKKITSRMSIEELVSYYIDLGMSAEAAVKYITQSRMRSQNSQGKGGEALRRVEDIEAENYAEARKFKEIDEKQKENHE